MTANLTYKELETKEGQKYKYVEKELISVYV